MNGFIAIDIGAMHPDAGVFGARDLLRQLVRHWPAAIPRRLCAFDDHAKGWRLLDEAAERDIVEADEDCGIAFDRLIRTASPAVAFDRPALRALILPQPLATAAQAGTIRALPRGFAAKLHWYVPDLSSWIGRSDARPPAALVLPALSLLREARHVAFSAVPVAHGFARDILRQPIATPIVIPPGADTPIGPMQTFSPARRSFILLATHEPEEVLRQVFDIFAPLWAEQADATLVVLDRQRDPDTLRLLCTGSARAAPSSSQHVSYGVQTGEMLTRLWPRTRAVLRLSPIHAFDRTAAECLAIGVPAITTAEISGLDPSMQLSGITTEACRQAVSRLLDDDAARLSWKAVSALTLPRWADFAQAVAQWALAAGEDL